jgi:antitoxin HicB
MARKTNVSEKSEVRRILSRPYARAIFPEEDGSYRGEILEFPGCISVGDTAAEALTSLEEIAESWLLSAIENRRPIPQPIDAPDGFSGKLMLRLPRTLHKKAAWTAERDGVSLNQFINACVAERVGVRTQPVMPDMQSMQTGIASLLLNTLAQAVAPSFGHGAVSASAATGSSYISLNGRATADA